MDMPRHLSVVAAVTLAMLLATQASKAADDAADRADALERDNRALRAQIKMLRDDLDQAKQTIAALKQQIDAMSKSQAESRAEPMAEDTDEKAASGIFGNEPDKKDEHDDADLPGKGKTYISALSILRDLPSDIRPHPTEGWDKYRIDEAVDLVRTQFKGATFKSTATVHDVQIQRSHRSPETGEPVWRISVRWRYEEQKYGKATLLEDLGGSTYYGDANDAKAAERLKPGDRVPVTGSIDWVNFRLQSADEWIAKIEFIGELEARSQHLPR